MNDYDMIKTRRRNRTLVVVEGNREKEEFFHSLLRAFPEIEINEDDIWIYRTNIYKLYYQIQSEYDEDFGEIDLPFIITKNEKLEKSYKRDFSHIYLIFDYECQDSLFSSEKIKKLQGCFLDASDKGKLYINYPMLESYLEVKEYPLDDSYEYAKIEGEFHSSQYKRRFNNSVLQKILVFPDRMRKELEIRYHIRDERNRNLFMEEILCLEQSYLFRLPLIIEKYIHDVSLQRQAEHHIFRNMEQLFKITGQRTYWKYIRWVFQCIIYHNVCKAYKLIYQQYMLSDDVVFDAYRQIDLNKILDIQNTAYLCEKQKYIWILNTSVFFVLDYNMGLLFQDMPIEFA